MLCSHNEKNAAFFFVLRIFTFIKAIIRSKPKKVTKWSVKISKNNKTVNKSTIIIYPFLGFGGKQAFTIAFTP